MRFNDFLESTYVSTNIQNQISYSPRLAAQVQAAQSLLNGQRTVLRWVSYAVLLFTYVLVKVGLRSVPLSPQELVAEFTAKTQAAKQTEQATPQQEPASVSS